MNVTGTNKTSETPQTDRLYELLYSIFGSDFRKEISLTVRADKLYWLIHLAEIGIQARLDQWRKQKGGMDAFSAASIASFQMDTEEMVNQTEKVLKTTPKKTEKKK